MKVGFIGLGNAGAKLAGSLLRNGINLTVRDLDKEAAKDLLDGGAGWAESPKEIAEKCDLVITCLPSPSICAEVMEAPDGLIAGLSPGKIWLERAITQWPSYIWINPVIEKYWEYSESTMIIKDIFH